jgi:putative ABC transport system permease protein
MALLRDLRFAIRSLLRSRGYAAAAILTLALGMTLCTTALVVVKAYLFTGLPYPAADRLYWIRYAAPDQDMPRGMEKLDWTSLSDVIEHPVAWDLDMFYLLGGQYAESAPGAWVTEGFVRGLGIQPSIGHGFDAEAFVSGGPNVAIISHRLWTTRFGSDPGIVGQTFAAYVSDRPNEAEKFTIIGVMPPSFWHINPYTDILAPLRAPTFPYMARLKAGVTAADASARISRLVRAGTAGVPEGWSARLESLRDAHVAQIRRPLTTASIAAALVLLVGCGNVAGLLLVRWTRRQREIAMRAALGASRAAIARMLIAEGTIIAAVATLLAVIVSSALTSWLAPLAQQQLGRSAPGGAVAFGTDLRVVGFAAAVGAATAILCSLVPMIALLRPGLAALHAGGRGATEGPRSRVMRNVLVTVQIAVSLALLSGSSLMLRSVGEMLRVNMGIDASQVVTGSLTLRLARYPDPAAWAGAFDRMLDALGRTAAVRTAGLTNAWPVQQPALIAIAPAGQNGGSTRAAVHGVTDGYFDALAIPMAAGRRFASRDRPGGEPVAILSETLSQRLGPSSGALGAYIDISESVRSGPPASVRRRIIGIARDVRQGIDDNDLADVYVPLMQAPTRFAFLIIRVSGASAEAVPQVRESLRQVDPELALDRVRPLQSIVDELVTRPQFMTTLLGALAAAAAVLALVGLYGVIAYAVRQREREVAVRLAVGAAPRQIARLFVRQAARLIASGLALGIAITLMTTRFIESELFGVSAHDPMALAGAAALFGLSALAAVWYPARRASLTDPAIALRSE